jgi:hypothetical protein
MKDLPEQISPLRRRMIEDMRKGPPSFLGKFAVWFPESSRSPPAVSRDAT